MKKCKSINMIVFQLFIMISYQLVATAKTPELNNALLQQSFSLAGERSQEIQYFVMESRMISYAGDGNRQGVDTYKLHLQCTPAKNGETEGDKYTCAEFKVKLGEAPDFTIPVLKDWSYNFKKLETGMDEAGQVLGIEHSKFEKLIDSYGKAIPPDKSYHVYNAFIDFHGMNNIFAEEMPGGAGIQDLKKIGQKIVHSASFIQAPVNVGSNVAEGSYFKNGEVTLEFKGISTVNNSICALVAYDSGESYFHMQMNPMPDMEVVTNGSSHYMGDIYIDLESYWVQKVTLSEFLVHETTLPVPPNKINAVSERMIVIRNVSEGDFFKE